MRAISLLFHDVYQANPAESGFVSDAANRYKLPLVDFDAQLAGVAQAHAACPLQITFDDGGVSYYTVAADRLEAYGWRGHCFVSTDFIGQRGFLDAAQIRELDARGHVIGSHSASHPTRFSALPFDQMLLEWSQSRAVLEDILGHSVEIASVPGGYFSAAVARAADHAGIRTLFTSEPVTKVDRIAECALYGRFTIRLGDPRDAAQRFVSTPWARSLAWASWNAKGLIKPVLGPSYMRIADWLLAGRS